MFLRNPEDIKTLDITKSELHPILSALNIGIMITNAKGEITFYNPKHAKMDGLTVEDVLGRKASDVYHLDDKTSLVMRCLRTKRPIVECPVLYKTLNGKIVDTIHNVFPLTQKGKLTGVISFITKYQELDDVADNSKNNVMQLSFIGDTDFCLDDIIGNSVPLLESINRARLTSQTDSPVLIYGETGTGKELFAQSIHNLSSRKKARYIAVNCAAIPENLLEGTLFGTSKGAFTGAIDKAGLFERANGGTLFLDEMNSMSREMQPKILRAIQERKVCRIGSHRELGLDLKIISSINNTLEHAVLSGEVRRDLLYRLSVVYISLPPLRERKGDIPILTDFFLKKYNRILCKNVSGVSSEVRALFEQHDWPGNVRELENIIEGSLNMIGRERLIEKWHMSSGFSMLDKKRELLEENGSLGLQQASRKINFIADRAASLAASANGAVDSDEETKKRDVLEVLSDADGNISDAAVIMGVSRQTFYRRVKALNVEIPRKSEGRQHKVIIRNLEQHDGNITRTAKALGISRQLLAYRMKKLGIDRLQLSTK